MRLSGSYRFSASAILLLTINLSFVFGCSRPSFLVGIGTGGKYLEAREEITRPRGGNVDKAIVNLEGIVRDDPTYSDSLTLLGRGYYKKGRYQNAKLILQRALGVNNKDEIAWLVFGLSQMRLGEHQQGLEAIKGGLTLLSRAMRDGYRDFPEWDRNGLVRSSLGRVVLLATKGLDERENLMQATELLFAQIDDEERFQRGDRTIKELQER